MKLTVKLLLAFHYWDANDYSHILFGDMIFGNGKNIIQTIVHLHVFM